jgi:hypothetical protein
MFLRFCVWNEKMGAYDNNVEENDVSGYENLGK